MDTGSYTYPQFIVDEKTHRIKVNLIDRASGRIVRHIPSTELSGIIRDYYSPHSIRFRGQAGVRLNGKTE